MTITSNYMSFVHIWCINWLGVLINFTQCIFQISKKVTNWVILEPTTTSRLLGDCYSLSVWYNVFDQSHMNWACLVSRFFPLNSRIILFLIFFSQFRKIANFFFTSFKHHICPSVSLIEIVAGYKPKSLDDDTKVV